MKTYNSGDLGTAFRFLRREAKFSNTDSPPKSVSDKECITSVTPKLAYAAMSPKCEEMLLCRLNVRTKKKKKKEGYE